MAHRGGEDAYSLRTHITEDAVLHACRAGDAARVVTACGAGVAASAAYTDALARDDLRAARLLLDASRQGVALLDTSVGDGTVSHPALYPALRGSLPMLQLLAQYPGCIPLDLEDELLAAVKQGAAAAPDRAPEFAAIAAFVEGYVLDTTPLEALAPERRAAKVRRACSRHDPRGSGSIPTSAIQAVASGLGTPLTPQEAWEVAVALTSKASAPPTAVKINDFADFWLGAA